MNDPVAAIAPVDGTLSSLARVPDPVFAEEMLGPGVAFVPSGGVPLTAYSPVEGTIAALKPHAFIVTTPRDFSVLVHMGIDTVRGPSEQFTTLNSDAGGPWKVGDRVEPGDAVIQWNARSEEDEAAGIEALVLMTVLDLMPENSVERPVAEGSNVAVGTTVLEIS